MYPINQQYNPIYRTNQLIPGLYTQFADEGLTPSGALARFC